MSSSPRGVADHPAKDQMEEIWRNGGRATEILNFLEENQLPVLNQKTIARYGQRYWSEKITLTTESSPQDLESVVEEIAASKLGTISKIGYTKKRYPGWEKIDGESVQVEKESIQQTLEIIPHSGTEIERAIIPKISIKRGKISGPLDKPPGVKLGMVIPDPQIGGWLDRDGKLNITQDEAALDVAHQLMLEANELYGIDSIWNLGDALDFPAFSSHRSAPGYLTTTQYAIDRWATELAVQRTVCPDAEIVALSGNHENRLNNMVVDKIPALHGISRANSKEPILSISYLCKYEENGIIGVEEYPDGCWWANNFLKFEHGSKVSSTLGGTAAKHLASSRVSTVYGHIHRQELLWSTVEDRSGSRDIFAGSPGCLCRIDGHVPSSQAGISPSGGQTGKKREKWQHGIFFIWYETGGKELSWVEPVLIHNGTAVYNGKRFTSSVQPNGESIDV